MKFLKIIEIHMDIEDNSLAEKNSLSHMILEQAREWIVFLESGSATSEDYERFQNWLSLSTEHREAYRNTLTIWENIGQLKILKKAEYKYNTTKYIKKNPESYWNKLFSGITIFGLFFLISLYAVSVHKKINVFPAANNTQVSDYHTNAGQTQELSLADGSIVSLGADSRLQFYVTEYTRNAELLRGEAYFSVENNTEKPFIVNAGHVELKVLGTEFNVNTHQKHVTVTVAEGAVQIFAKNKSSDSHAARLVAGDKISVNRYDDSGSTPVNQINTETVGAWRKGMLIYDKTPLQDVTDDLERYLDLNIAIMDLAINEYPVTAIFQIKEKMQILTALSNALNLKITQVSRDQIIIKQE